MHSGVLLWCASAAALVARPALRTAAPRRRLARLRMVEATEITMPALSSTMTSGRVVSWLKGVGDKIEAGDPVMVVESDKADMEVESFDEGYRTRRPKTSTRRGPSGLILAALEGAALVPTLDEARRG